MSVQLPSREDDCGFASTSIVCLLVCLFCFVCCVVILCDLNRCFVIVMYLITKYSRSKIETNEEKRSAKAMPNPDLNRGEPVNEQKSKISRWNAVRLPTQCTNRNFA
jgi:hypothetical protein